MSTERGLINLLFGAVKRPDRRSVKLFDGAHFKTLLSNTYMVVGPINTMAKLKNIEI
jgi:hypothetical protein